MIDYIEKIVKELVKETKTRNPKEICEAKHIVIKHDPLSRLVKAYFLYINGCKGIVINEDINQFFEKFLLAHELGHAILHCNTHTPKMFRELRPFDSTGTMEYEANLFAAELLIEDHIVYEMLHTSRMTYIEVAQTLGVPVKLMEFKLVLLKHKGYIMNDLPTAQADFFKYDNGEYDEWFVD